jgi:hypothetical protein
MRDQMRDYISNPDDLDRMLDSALATYADPGRDSGLEGRVLAAVAIARTKTRAPIAPRRWRWLPWTIALPVAACLILLWMFSSTRVVHAPAQPQQTYQSDQASDQVQSPSPKVTATTPQPAPQKVHSSAAEARDLYSISTARLKSGPVTGQPDGSASRTPLPKLDVFPTPQPLTPQEQAMLAFSQEAPAAQVKALSAVQALDEESFALAASHISLFEPPAEGKN